MTQHKNKEDKAASNEGVHQEPGPSMVIKSLERTSTFCPVQWEGHLADGRMIYMRYRSGNLAISISESPTDDIHEAVRAEVFHEGIFGGPMDGFMSEKEIKAIIKDCGFTFDTDGPLDTEEAEGITFVDFEMGPVGVDPLPNPQYDDWYYSMMRNSFPQYYYSESFQESLERLGPQVMHYISEDFGRERVEIDHSDPRFIDGKRYNMVMTEPDEEYLRSHKKSHPDTKLVHFGPGIMIRGADMRSDSEMGGNKGTEQ